MRERIEPTGLLRAEVDQVRLDDVVLRQHDIERCDLTRTDVGFDPKNLTTFEMAFTGRECFGATGNITPIGSLEFKFGEGISGIALLLAVIGIYGVMSQSVSQRTSEIGIRVAFGATAQHVLGSVLGRGLAVIGIGMVIGVAASLGLTRVIASALFGVTATDPATYALVLGLFSLSPAWPASSRRGGR
jgi:ABC-type antimicrobial peptide transport system permease subunit